MTTPTKGGRYFRDPQTGDLTPETKPEVSASEAAQAEVQSIAPQAHAPASKKKGN